MEFFHEVGVSGLEVAELKRLLTMENLPALCSSIQTVTCSGDGTGDIYCVWGAFDVRREEIRYGVRFSLLNCPHALAWTVTWHENDQRIVIHCTIDEQEQDEMFVDSIHEFVAAWSAGLSGRLKP
ncbi:MAG TPA: hypothetical protein ENK49_14140 [Gammaproteobacteria bacterium]|nr:hypothetical protein [Gammaproteobacteria bacterium]